MERERGGGLSLSEGDAWNITTYELVPDLYRDPFVVGYHVPESVGQWREWNGGKRWGVPDICNTTIFPVNLQVDGPEPRKSQDDFVLSTVEDEEVTMLSHSSIIQHNVGLVPDHS